MKKIKIAQIGIAHDHATEAWKTICSHPEVFDVVGFAAPEPERTTYAHRLADFANKPEMTVEEILAIPDLEAVVIENDEVTLTKYATMAAERGLHIQMDKPGSEDHEAFAALFDLAEKNGTVLHLGYMYRYNPAVIELMEKIKNGELGEIQSVETHMDCLHPAKKRQWLDRLPGGMMFFLGCHLVDLILQIQGMPEDIIPLNVSSGFDGVTAEDSSMAVFQYKNGVSFAKTYATEIGGFQRRQLVVVGSKGTVELKPLEYYVTKEEGTRVMYTDICEAYEKPQEDYSWTERQIHHRSVEYTRYDAMLLAFAKMVRGEMENPYTYEYEKQLHKVVLKACGKDIDWK